MGRLTFSAANRLVRQGKEVIVVCTDDAHHGLLGKMEKSNSAYWVLGLVKDERPPSLRKVEKLRQLEKPGAAYSTSPENTDSHDLTPPNMSPLMEVPLSLPLYAKDGDHGYLVELDEKRNPIRTYEF